MIITFPRFCFGHQEQKKQNGQSGGGDGRLAQRGAVCVHVKYVRSLVTSCLELQTRNLN